MVIYNLLWVLNTRKTIEFKEDVARVQVADESELEQINPNETITIEENGSVLFEGLAVDFNFEPEPKELKVKGKITEMKGEETKGRIFYNEDSESIITSLIQEDIKETGKLFTNTGDITSNVTGSLQGGDSSKFYFEQSNLQRKDEQKIGDDTIFAGVEKKTGGTIVARFENIDYKADEFKRLFFNAYFNTKGDFTFTVEYKENGNSYLWRPDSNLDGYEQLKLRREKAEPQQVNVSTDDVLEFRANTNGKLQGDRAFAIDGVGFETYNVVSRDTINLTVGDVSVSSDSETIRKFNESLSNAISKINSKIDEYIVVDGDTVKTVNTGAEESSIPSDKILEKDKDFRADKIKNVAKIVGDDVTVIQENKQSIDFYGFKETRRIRDESINTQKDAQDLAEKIINKHSFRDTKFTIVTADESDYNISLGSEISNIASVNNFVIKSVQKTTNNRTRITLENES